MRERMDTLPAYHWDENELNSSLCLYFEHKKQFFLLWSVDALPCFSFVLAGMSDACAIESVLKHTHCAFDFAIKLRLKASIMFLT